ncbi:MAG TPA: copper resistance system multicopper oxidase [Steroidobacteraceae bacterium]|jgi:CopA family copper-resistance protein|nr:copper resistance system multicopper oxidase [Steroidobacteraceae bacterium]
MTTRRRFVQGLAGGALLTAASPARRGTAWAGGPAALPLAGAVGGAPRGSVFDLSLETRAVNYTGAARLANCVNGGTPGPLLQWREGDVVTLRVTNRMREPSSIHWHGVLVPADMDGVPGLSFGGIAPGSTFVYRFPVMQSGTYWYHSHTHFQEQTGLYGPIVITPRDGERHPSSRDYVVMLNDWTDQDPDRVFATLKRDSDYYDRHRRTVGDFLAEAHHRGLRATLANWSMWSRMRMDPTDIADVSGLTYTYLMNGHTPAANWTALFDHGESVRLRFINGSAMSYFDVRIPGLDMTVIAADGQDIEPVTVQEFRIGTAEVYDVLVRPNADSAYTIFAQSMDRSGYARGTLAPRAGMQAPVPPLDPRPVLTMADMGMSMAGMHDMPGMPGMAASPASAPARRAHYGPGVDMQVQTPWTRLDDPGVGLRNNGRRVLNYADLYTSSGPTDPRGAGREIELHLTGHMQRFMWSFNGRKFSEAEPLQFVAGERLRLVLINDTMMTHPIHLHGMWSELQATDGSFQARKHTISVQPAQKISYLVTANPLGRWAYHCHLLYHMQAGMFREVRVSTRAAHALAPAGSSVSTHTS